MLSAITLYGNAECHCAECRGTVIGWQRTFSMITLDCFYEKAFPFKKLFKKFQCDYQEKLRPNYARPFC